ncbi:unnamed protein product [Brachionus calyciflorus]|uniref:Uncharacterized protein n=1 Tax=Brachionus calyciflorus TaxID=104777 RepID=A0A814JI58_9BILA|nr:unnamed protein product [Brachionus calyciflorus]
MAKTDVAKTIGMSLTTSALLVGVNEKLEDPAKFDRSVYFFATALGGLNGIYISNKYRHVKFSYIHLLVGLSASSSSYYLFQKFFTKKK